MGLLKPLELSSIGYLFSIISDSLGLNLGIIYVAYAFYALHNALR
jgi:hypothetical protein